MNENEISNKVIGAAIEVNKRSGSGILESAYEICLGRQLNIQGLKCQRQLTLP